LTGTEPAEGGGGAPEGAHASAAGAAVEVNAGDTAAVAARRVGTTGGVASGAVGVLIAVPGIEPAVGERVPAGDCSAAGEPHASKLAEEIASATRR
jgi:hypothetical protein